MKQTIFAIFLALAAGAIAGPVPQVQQSKRGVGSLYADYSTGATIPFTVVPYQWNGDPLVSFTLNNDTTIHSAPVDTGSSAYLIGSTLYPNFDANTFNQQYHPAVEYLSSSYRLYTGWWVPTTINFKGTNGGTVTSQIYALVVDKMVKCYAYDQSNPGQCPTEHTEVQCAPGECKMNYMGIGFGRSGDGQGEDTPNKNSMLNIQSINGQTVSNFRTGYIINDQGVTVGLTSGNTNDFNLVKLSLGASGVANDWAGVTGCISVTQAGQSQPAGSCIQASILLDSGIDYSYLKLTTDSGVTGLTDSYQHLPDGTKVTITFGETNGNSTNDDASFTFTQSASDTNAPAYTLVKTNSAAFINTGSHFYRNNDILYDAVGGYWGLRARN